MEWFQGAGMWCEGHLTTLTLRETSTADTTSDMNQPVELWTLSSIETTTVRDSKIKLMNKCAEVR